MHRLKLKSALSVILFSASIFGGTTFGPTIALAADSDEDIICFEFTGANGQDETECDTRGNFKAECALTDPENTTDHCQSVNSTFSRPANDLTNGDAPASKIVSGEVDVKTTRQ